MWVDSDGLQSVAGLFGEQAARVTADTAAAEVDGVFTASAAAVRAVHYGLDTAATTIGDRLNDTGALIDAARNGYERTDVANAINIGAVAGGRDSVGED